MSTRTYFARPSEPRTIFVSVDSNERARLKRRGWLKLYRDAAIRQLGGQVSFNFALAKCGSGKITHQPFASAICGGHDASTEAA